jgi:phosphonate transport system substrate-binding protein
MLISCSFMRNFAITTLVIFVLSPHVCAADSVFKIGIFPRRGSDVTMKMFQPLAEHIGQTLNAKVKLLAFKDYDSFRQALFSRQFDLVHLNHYLYIEAHRDHGYDVLTMNEEFGRDTLSSALFVHADSGIERIEDLRGKKIVFGGGKDAFIAYISNRYLLLKHGLNQEDFQEDFAINPPNALLAAYFRRADAGGAGDIAIQLPAIRKMIDPDKIRVLAKSEPLPHIPWAIRRELDSNIKDRIHAILTGLQDTPEGQSILQSMKMTGMRSASDNDYEVTRSMVADIQSDAK